MKKLLFILFFPITVPIYLLVKLFEWVKDSFIPFMQYDVIPFVDEHIVSKIRKYATYKAIQRQEKETVDSTNPQDTIQQTADLQCEIPTELSDNKTASLKNSADSEVSPEINNVALQSSAPAAIAQANNAETEQAMVGKDSPNDDVGNMYNKKLENPPIDYAKIMAIGRTEEDSLYLGAFAVAVYEQTISISTLQRRLKMGYARAARLLNDFSERLIITDAGDGQYHCCITKEDFERLLQFIEENVNTKEKHILSADEVEKLFQQYSIQYDEIEYHKDSKIVSIFTKKWREICRHEFIALDFETTGLNYKKDRIIEVAAIKYVDGLETDKMVTLVNPLMHIPADATQVHHITDDMVADAPTERSVVPQLIEFLGDSLIVGHFVNFDLSFLEVAAQRYGYNVKYNYIDTLSVSKKLFKGLPNYKLGTVAGYLHIDTGTLHRAEADVRVCAEIIDIALNSLIDDC